MILADNPADKADKAFAGRNGILLYVDQTNPVVQFVHVLGTLVQINNGTLGLLHGRIRHIQQILRLSFSFCS